MLLLIESHHAEQGVASLAGHSLDSDHVAALVDVQRAVLAHRVRHLEVAPDRTEAVKALLAEVAAAGPAWTRMSPSTVNVSVVDGDGTACTITASAGYGAGVSAPGTGVWLNNCLGERELNRTGTHALPPGHRLVSNMAPSVARRTDGAVLAIGSPGADRITTAILQTMWPLVSESVPLQEAIDRPRLHVTCHDDGSTKQVEYEADLPHPRVAAEDLPWREHPSHSMYFGGVGAAMLEPGGRLDAAADPRREGAVVVTGTTSTS